MKIALIVLNYNDEKNIISLIQRNYTFFSKIVIVDNNSLDTSTDFLIEKLSSFKNVKLLKNKKNLGFACGNNTGIKFILSSSDFDYIFCINSDIIVENDVLIRCVERMKINDDYALLSINIKEFNLLDGIPAWKFPKYRKALANCFWFYRKNNKYNETYDLTTNNFIDVDVVRGSFMCFRTKALKEIGFFDENTFLYNEENIICTKLRDKGYKVGLITDEYYIHNHPKKDNSIINMKLFKANIQSTYYYFSKYRKINWIQKCILKFAQFYSYIEQAFVNFLKRIFKRRKK